MRGGFLRRLNQFRFVVLIRVLHLELRFVVLLKHGDRTLRFGDADGVLVLPRAHEDRILAAAEEIDLARAALPEFELDSFRAGHLTPVFFGSAILGVLGLSDSSLTIAGGALDNTSGAPVTLSTNNAVTLTGSFAFGGTNSAAAHAKTLAYSFRYK